MTWQVLVAGASQTNPFLQPSPGYGTTDDEVHGISISLPQSTVAYGATGSAQQQQLQQQQQPLQYQSGYSSYSGKY